MKDLFDLRECSSNNSLKTTQKKLVASMNL